MYYEGKYSKVSLYINTARKSMAQIKSELKCDIIINGGLYDMSTFKPNCHLRANYKDLASEPYIYDGYGWNDSKISFVSSSEKSYYKDYICCCLLIKNGMPQSKIYYDSAMGGRRGRTAIGLKKNGDLFIWCSKDGSSDAMTPEGLRDKLAKFNLENAIMLDGGGSSQCIMPAGTITSTRRVHNYICIWIDKKNTQNAPVQSSSGTSQCPYAEPTGYIRRGSRGTGAQWVQWHLNKYGYNLVVDGIFGALSDTALRSFQKLKGLQVDGICGAITREKLKGQL